jgi:hypothetical protein
MRTKDKAYSKVAELSLEVLGNALFCQECDVCDMRLFGVIVRLESTPSRAIAEEYLGICGQHRFLVHGHIITKAGTSWILIYT